MHASTRIYKSRPIATSKKAKDGKTQMDFFVKHINQAILFFLLGFVFTYSLTITHRGNTHIAVKGHNLFCTMTIVFPPVKAYSCYSCSIVVWTMEVLATRSDPGVINCRPLLTFSRRYDPDATRPLSRSAGREEGRD